MNNYLPQISVLMPTYNAEKYIGEAIKMIKNKTVNVK
jgi:glycosyltransferase involved in cell wall biosynthesis